MVLEVVWYVRHRRLKVNYVGIYRVEGGEFTDFGFSAKIRPRINPSLAGETYIREPSPLTRKQSDQTIHQDCFFVARIYFVLRRVVSVQGWMVAWVVLQDLSTDTLDRKWQEASRRMLKVKTK